MPAKKASQTPRKPLTKRKTTRSSKRRPNLKPLHQLPALPFFIHHPASIMPLLGLPGPSDDSGDKEFSRIMRWSKREASVANDLLLKGYQISFPIAEDSSCQAVSRLAHHLTCEFSAVFDQESSRILVMCVEDSVEDWDVCDDE